MVHFVCEPKYPVEEAEIHPYFASLINLSWPVIPYLEAIKADGYYADAMNLAIWHLSHNYQITAYGQYKGSCQLINESNGLCCLLARTHSSLWRLMETANKEKPANAKLGLVVFDNHLDAGSQEETLWGIMERKTSGLISPSD